MQNPIDKLKAEVRKELGIQSNADRIRAMDDAELAEFASHYVSCGYCDARQPYGNCGKTCKERLLKWLQSEAE